MKKLITLGFAVWIAALAVGCGPKGTDPSLAAPPITPEKQTQDIEDAMKSGKVDASAYGKY